MEKKQDIKYGNKAAKKLIAEIRKANSAPDVKRHIDKIKRELIAYIRKYEINSDFDL